MNESEAKVDNMERALRNVLTAGDLERMLPDQVFGARYQQFLFFQSDHLFTSEFVGIVQTLLRDEHAHVACLLNRDKAESFTVGGPGTFFLDATTSGEVYANKLRDGGPADGWLYGVDRYAITSDSGEWYIYCEKSNDIAVIGLCDAHSIEKFETALAELWAKPIEELLSEGSSPQFPFNNLVSTWREGLVKNYGKKGRDEKF